MTSTAKKLAGVMALIVLLYGAYLLGRSKQAPTIRMYSDMTSQLQGHKIYLIDTPVMCTPKPGQAPKYIGQLQIDLDLHSGKLVVAKNTVPAWFDCK